MPTDTRRLPVPDVTHPYNELNKTKDGKRKLRRSDRDSSGLRKVYLDSSVISQAKGSAYIEIGNTKVIAAVYGPREVMRRKDFSIRGQLNCEMKFATFSCPTRRQHQQDDESKQFSALLEQALEPAVCLYKFPKSTIDVYVEVLENDGSCMAAAITVCGMALADAGIDMFDIVVGAALRRHGDNVFIDPTFSEENFSPPKDKYSYGNLTIGYMPTIQQIATVIQEGDMSVKDVSMDTKKLITACQETAQIMTDFLMNSTGASLTKGDNETMVS